MRVDTDGGSCTLAPALMRGGSRLRVVGPLKPAPGVAPGSLPYQGSALLLSYEGRSIAHAACIPDEGVAPPPPLCDRGVLLLDESGSIELVGFAPTTSGPPDQRATKLRHSSLFDEFGYQEQDLHLPSHGPQPCAALPQLPWHGAPVWERDRLGW